MKIVHYKDGRVGFFMEDILGYKIWHHKTPQEAVDMATKIINHSYPHTTAVKGREERLKKNGFHAGWLREEVDKCVKIRDPGPRINQGCHRP